MIFLINKLVPFVWVMPCMANSDIPYVKSGLKCILVKEIQTWSVVLKVFRVHFSMMCDYLFPLNQGSANNSPYTKELFEKKKMKKNMWQSAESLQSLKYLLSGHLYF